MGSRPHPAWTEVGLQQPLPKLIPFEPYGGAPVSFEGIVVTWPGRTPEAQLPPNAARLNHLERWLRQCVVDSLPPMDRNGSIPQQNAALVAGKGSLLRAFVGLEDGSFVQFPAREVTADRGGYVESGDRLLVFAKLISPPWTYVAELDKAQYLVRRQESEDHAEEFFQELFERHHGERKR